MPHSSRSPFPYALATLLFAACGGEGASLPPPPADAVDFMVSLTGPTQGEAGDTLALTLEVVNRGGVEGVFRWQVGYRPEGADYDTMERVYGRSAGVVPGHGGRETVAANLPLAHGFASGPYRIFAKVTPEVGRDPVHENDDDDYLADLVGLPCEDDAFEQDDRTEAAKPLVLWERQHHNHCYDGTDWMWFDGVKGEPVQLRVGADGYSIEARIYRPDRLNASLAEVQGGFLIEGYQESPLLFDPPETGRYYVRVKSWAGDPPAADSAYEVLLVPPINDLYPADLDLPNEAWAPGTPKTVWFRLRGDMPLGRQPVACEVRLSSDALPSTDDRTVGRAMGEPSLFHSYEMTVTLPEDLASGPAWLYLVVDTEDVEEELYEDNNVLPAQEITVL